MAALSWPSVRTLCGIFCCPPFPSKIAAKLAFVPPTATYKIGPPRLDSKMARTERELVDSEDDAAGTSSSRGVGASATDRNEAFTLELTELAEWQFTERELDMIEACTAVTSRGETIACIYVRTQPDTNYGMSTGRPTELNLYADIDAAWDCLTKRYGIDPDCIILYGQSIGTVPTIDLAARRKVAGVVLHSPLMSGMRIAFPETKQTWFFDAFPSIDKVERIESVVLVIHGTDDEVINVAHGRAIYARCPRAVDPLWVAGAGHNDIEHYDEYLQRLHQFLALDLPTS